MKNPVTNEGTAISWLVGAVGVPSSPPIVQSLMVFVLTVFTKKSFVEVAFSPSAPCRDKPSYEVSVKRFTAAAAPERTLYFIIVMICVPLNPGLLNPNIFREMPYPSLLIATPG